MRRLLAFIFVPVLPVLILGASGSAEAHFVLQAPACWMSQDAYGGPEKLGPCGDEGGGTPTGTVTAFQSGQTITITINEVIYHPGHYRISLATNDRSEIPEEPKVTAGATACGSVPIMDPPVFPVLADGVFLHTKPFTAPQTMQLTLPSNVTCTHCTLQVLEFMSDHPLNNPGGCFYHHCADISISAAPGAAADGGSTTPTPMPSSGGCSISPASPLLTGLAFFLLFAALLRRRLRR
jgi:hypothetical protein